MTTDTQTAILDAAERRASASGYAGFSFRDIAQDVGIKSASIHYHFPTKAALVARLAQRYTDRFLAGLAEAPAGPARLAAWRDAFRRGLRTDARMCLCGILGAESAALPAPVAAAARAFVDAALESLEDAFDGPPTERRTKALQALATLEGAAVLARSYGDLSVFDAATRGLAPPPGGV